MWELTLEHAHQGGLHRLGGLRVRCPNIEHRGTNGAMAECLLYEREVHVAGDEMRGERVFTLTPEGDTYKLSGEWDLLGDVRSDGAGGQNRTGYARLFRAALYQ